MCRILPFRGVEHVRRKFPGRWKGAGILGCILVLVGSGWVQAQEVHQKRLLERKAWEIGVGFTQWGVTGFYRRMVPRTYTHWRGWEVEVRGYRHPREQKVQPIVGPRCGPLTPRPYVFGKVNYLYSASVSARWERMLFDEAPVRGVQVWTVLAPGITGGIVKPYELITIQGITDSQCRYVISTYGDPNFLAQDRIVSRNSPWNRLSTIQGIVGVAGKAGLVFRWMREQSGVYYSLETGISVVYFLMPVQLMVDPIDRGRNLFPSTYLSFAVGVRKTQP